MATFDKQAKARSAQLPKPDSFGNYWLGNKPHGPAIFKSGLTGDKIRFFLSLGGEGGVVFEGSGSRIRYFNNPQMALMAFHDYERRD